LSLPISRIFDGLARSHKYIDELNSNVNTLFEAFQNAHLFWTRTTLKESEGCDKLIESFYSAEGPLLEFLGNMPPKMTQSIRVKEISELLKNARECAYSLEETLYEMRRKRESAHGNDDVDTGIHHMSKVISALHEFYEFLESDSTSCGNLRKLLVLGEGGIGKSHLFADVANQHISMGFPALLFLGQHVSIGNPWDQFLSEIDLKSVSIYNFLGALDSASQTCGIRSLIFVDAINEGEGKNEWISRLPGFLQDIENLPRISIAISCRTNYAKHLTKNVPDGDLCRIVHRGFAGYEYEAAQIYLDNAGIERPSAPVLAPEFSNPLFLKTFCQSLRRNGEKTFPKGVQGISKIFDFYVESLEGVLLERGIDADPSDKVARKVLMAIASEFAATRIPWLSRERAKDIIVEIYPETRFQMSLLKALMDEGALSDDWHYDGPDDRDGIEIIRFSYERFSDHFITCQMLDEHLNTDYPESSFKEGAPLNIALFKEKLSHRYGIIEPLSVQIPERCGRELVALIGKSRAKSYPYKECFLSSLIWRNPEATCEETLDYINQINQRDSWLVMESLLRVATVPKHHFNADFFHSNLIDKSMPDRDVFWSVPLAQNHYEQDAIHTLINWAWRTNHIATPESTIRLCAIALTWFLTTSHRGIRDKSTKALVSMLKCHPMVMVEMIETFHGVNDPYLVERLYGVAYGVAMFCSSNDALMELSSIVFEKVFKDNSPPKNLLLRDYARGIIESASVGLKTE
jgi:hypothetical protein